MVVNIDPLRRVQVLISQLVHIWRKHTCNRDTEFVVLPFRKIVDTCTSLPPSHWGSSSNDIVLGHSIVTLV